MHSPASSPGTHPALAELSGTVLESRYQLGQVLGAGGMGAVFEGTHLRLDRRVAIKVLRPVFVGHDEFIRRFLREAKAASKIRHRNVVEILDYGEAAGGLVYSVMEFLDGQDLDQLLRAQPTQRLPWMQTCNILVQVASGLKAAHASGVIHRDIKPANCFLTHEDGEPVVKVVDFGIAKMDDADQSQQLTDTSQVLGTPNYIAPELVRTKSPASPQSDVYSVGVLAYRMLTGRLPFGGETVFEVLRRSCFDPVPPLREHAPELPQAVDDFVLTLLAKEPGERPPDMLTVRDDLLALGRGTLAPREIEIPSSAALSLDPPMSAGSTGSLDGPTMRQEMGLTKAPPLTSTMRFDLAQDPPVTRAPLAETEPTDPSARPPLQPPSERPAAIGQAPPIPRDGLPTLPNAQDAFPAEPHKRRGWVIGSILATMMGALGLGTVLSLSAEDHDPAVTAAQATTPHVETVVPKVSGSPPLESVETQIVDPVPTAPEQAPPSEPAPTHEPDVSPSKATPDVAIVEPTPAEPTSSRTSPSNPPPAPKHRSAKRKPVKTEPSKSTTPSTPPTDNAIFKRLKEQIKSTCSLGGKSTRVTFRIRPSGSVFTASVVPANSCAEKLVINATFRPRNETSTKILKVE